MKKLIISALAVGALFAQTDNASLEKQIKELKAKLAQVEQMAIQNQKKVNPIAANNHLYWQYKLQSNYDFLYYKLTNGDKKTNNFFTNKIILTGVAKPSNNLKATLRIVAYNVYGTDGNPQAMYQNTNSLANETPDDTNLRVRDAFFNYNFGPNNGLMFSAGRRPATEGFPANLRNNDNPNSPLAHLVNMEFDGFSFQIGNGVWSDWSDKFSDWGTWIKFCAGRGYAPNEGAYSPTPYAKDDKINDFAGFIFVPYDDGQYSFKTEVIKAWNVRGATDKNNVMGSMTALGDYFGFNAVFAANGIGNDNFDSEWLNDFLDNTVAFVSFATSKTLPASGKEMLGTTDSKTGTSWWIGAQMPADEDGITNFGFNYVHGSKYWRSMTYGEDTLIGSIAAVRGNAYEVYYNGQIVPHLTWGIRATYIKYDYTGSNASFGVDGTPYKVDDDPTAVKSAKDLRVYIRYNF
ncbi:DUF3373 family protein [Caminibacter pacificus]|jgi:hypothetical protein